MSEFLDKLTPEEREEIGSDILEAEARRNPRWVEQQLQAVFARLSSEGVFDGLSPEQVRAGMREVAEDLGLSPDRGLS